MKATRVGALLLSMTHDHIRGSGLARKLLGSVSSYVVSRARGSVSVVR